MENGPDATQIMQSQSSIISIASSIPRAKTFRLKHEIDPLKKNSVGFPGPGAYNSELMS
jgi:hypothetical protein